MPIKSVDDILDNFGNKVPSVDEKSMIGVWLPKETKKKYSELQKNSKLELSKTIRDVVVSSIETSYLKYLNLLK